MTVGELKKMLDSMPTDMEIELFNPCYEWYGLEPIQRKSLKRIDNKLVFNFSGVWDEYDFKSYQNERRNKRG